MRNVCSSCELFFLFLFAALVSSCPSSTGLFSGLFSAFRGRWKSNVYLAFAVDGAEAKITVLVAGKVGNLCSKKEVKSKKEAGNLCSRVICGYVVRRAIL